jgi:hypothetical protein
MTLSELLNQVSAQDTIPPSRLKDLKTAVRYLARASGAASPDLIPHAETLARHYRTTVQSYFASMTPQPSPHTIRNVLNNLSFLFRRAYSLGLIATFTHRPERTRRDAIAEADRTSPYKRRKPGDKYACPFHEWPEAIQKEWTRYSESKKFEIRLPTQEKYQRCLSEFIGYSRRMEALPISSWDDLFDLHRLAGFLQWHAERCHVSPITIRGLFLAKELKTFARHYQRPELPALVTFIKKLPTPEPMHDKQNSDHCITLQELEDVGLSLLKDARTPPKTPVNASHQYPGTQKATRHQMGLILRLLVRVPLRNRNIREMQLNRNLYKDQHGIWQLRFHGDELKVRARRGRINEFRLPFPTDLLPHLEEFLATQRPVLSQNNQETHVFINRFGHPYTQTTISAALTDHVMLRLGKRFYPHLVRTIWTDTFLLSTHDISTAAFMLNDSPETMIKHYHELRANDHIQKAQQFTQSLLGTSKEA